MKIKQITILCLCLGLISCGTDNTGGNVNRNPVYENTLGPYDSVIESTDPVTIPAASYYTYSVLEPYEFPAKEKNPASLKNSITRAGASMEEGKVVMIRNYPVGAMESEKTVEAYSASDDYRRIRQIEVFDYRTGESDYRPVTGLEDRRLHVDELTQNPDGSLSFIAWEVPDTGGQKYALFRVDASGQLAAQYDLSVNPDGRYIPYYDRIYSLLPTDGYEINPTVLTQTDLASETKSIIAENVFAVTRRENRLYYMTEIMNDRFEYELYFHCYDMDTGESRKISRIDAQRKNRSNEIGANRMRIVQIAYCEEEKTLILGGYMELYAYSLRDHKITPVIESDAFLELLGADSEAVLLSVRAQQLHVYSIDTPAGQSQSLEERLPKLNVCVNAASPKSFENANQETISGMRADDIVFRVNTVMHKDSKEAYVNTMAKKLLAGDSDFDIFEVDSEMLALLKEGYFEDLTKYPVLNGYFDRMNPGTVNLCRIGGTTALVPALLGTSVLAVNPSRCGGDNPVIPDSLEGFLAFGESLTPKDGTAFMASASGAVWMKPWFEQFTANFMARRMDDETAKAALTELFGIIASAKERKTVMLGADSMPDTCVTATALNAKALRYGRVFAPLPKLEESCGQAFSGSWYAVNPNSPNKDLAVLFLAYRMETDRLNNEKWYSSYVPATGHEGLYQAYLDALADSERLHMNQEIVEEYYKAVQSMESAAVPAEKAASDLFSVLRHIRDE